MQASSEETKSMDGLLLRTIQKNGKLNDIYSVGDSEENLPGCYVVTKHRSTEGFSQIIFQSGSRNNPESVTGVNEGDLLEIVRDRLRGYQNNEKSKNRENAYALKSVEEALLWLNHRTENRLERLRLESNKEE